MPTSQESSLLAGVNVLLEGPTGTGKTHSLGTLIDLGVETFVLFLESGNESLLGYYTDAGKLIPPNLHWHSLALAQPGGFGRMAQNASLIASSTYEALCKIQDMTRAQNNPFEKLLKVLSNFEDQRTGKTFGPVDTWGPDRVIVIDGLTGLSNFAFAMQVGLRPTAAKNDYGVAQKPIEQLIRYMCDGCKCHFVLISHVERETDEVIGGSKITVSTVGQKLAPKIPAMFSDVILTVRNGTSWSWSTANPQADLKTRNLAYSEKLEPSFKHIFSKWQSRGGKFTPTVKA